MGSSRAFLFSALAGLGSLLLNLATPVQAQVQFTWTNLAGQPGGPGNSDGATGLGARLRDPLDVAVDASGNLFIADTGNHTLRKVAPSGVTTTLAGLAGVGDTADGIGSRARFISPSGATVDASGNIYVVDSNNGRLCRITPDGVVLTLIVTDGSGQGLDRGAFRVARDAGGNFYLTGTKTDTIRKITPAGVQTILSGRISSRAARMAPLPAPASGAPTVSPSIPAATFSWPTRATTPSARSRPTAWSAPWLVWPAPRAAPMGPAALRDSTSPARDQRRQRRRICGGFRQCHPSQDHARRRGQNRGRPSRRHGQH